MTFFWGGGGQRSTFLVGTVGLCSRLAVVFTFGMQRSEKNPESVCAALTSCSFLDVDGLFGPVDPQPHPHPRIRPLKVQTWCRELHM